MELGIYFKRAGLTTGPSSIVTRHTHLGSIKNILLGNHVKAGSATKKKSFQAFGTVMHARFLQPKLKGKELRGVNKLWKTLSIVDKRKIDGMMLSLKKHPVVSHLMLNTENEKTRRIIFCGVKFQFTPDAVKAKKTGIDLKTTVCNELEKFIEKAFEYGYFRQGITYMAAHKPALQEFIIIGICKIYPHKVFIVDILQFKDKILYCKQELNFLLYFYKNYGNFQELERAQKKQPKSPEGNGRVSKKV